MEALYQVPLNAALFRRHIRSLLDHL
jgi:hypothetical protein